MKKPMIVAVLVLTSLGLSVPSVHANGCSAAIETPEPKASERTEVASIVLEGVVLSVSDHDEFSKYKATIEVHQYLKGDGPAIVSIDGFHDLWTLYACPDGVAVGDQLLFFADGNPEDVLTTSLIGAKGSTMLVDPQTIAQIMSVTGSEPTIPTPSVRERIKAIDSTTWTGLVTLTLVGIVLVRLGVIRKKKDQ
ncbi:MAG TPA: hypothetical protein VJP78_08110 [Thermoleophilia bacterium]|nr:hypothetical protein [Thermoleophilia bacterium]